MRGHESFQALGDGQDPEPRMEALASQVRRVELADSSGQAPAVRRDASEQLAQRQRPVAADGADPDDIGGDAPEGDRRGRWALENPLDLPEPEREHLLDVGEDLGWGPMRLILSPVVLGQLPRTCVHDPGAERQQTADRGVEAVGLFGRCRHGASVARPSVAVNGWVYHGWSSNLLVRIGGMTTVTETLSRGAANQAGAIVNKDAYAEAKDFLPLNGLDHVEFWVGNARQASAYFRALWGFTPVAFSGLETGVRDRASYVMRQNDITIVLTAPLTPDGEIAEHVHRHGDGVRDIAFAVNDATASWRETTTRGARSAIEPVELDGGEDGVLRRSAVWAYGEVRHSFIDRSSYHGVFAPGYRKIKKPARAAGGLSLLEIDHCVGNVALGDMNRFVDYYRDVFGFAQLIHYDDKVIHTDYSALMSKVMTNGNGRVKFPINEPAAGKKKSQIQEFLDWYLDAGTQHIALRTEDIVSTVRQLRENGIEFLGMPHAYYETLADRVGDVGVPIDTLEELGIEADRDEEGYLLQIFTRPIQDRPTFFFEIIERHGSRGFGVGNFKALFEAIEIEQARRGNL